jgi:uncharacterized protein YjdB
MDSASRGGTRRGVAADLLPVFLLSLTIVASGCGGSLSSVGRSSTNTLTSIAISPVTPSVAQGQSQQLTAAGVFSDGSKQDMTQTVTWASTQPSVASISHAGLALGNLVGSVKITATSGSVTASDTLTVTSATLVSIAVSPQNLSVPKGTGQPLNAVATFSDGSQRNITDSATWSVVPTGIAIVSGTGVFTGQAVGSATVTASLASISGSDALIVSPAAVVSIAVSPRSLSVPKGMPTPLSAVATFSDGTQQNITGSATWSAAPPGVATISAAGVVTGQAVGSATITASLASVSGSDALTVSPAALVSIAVNPQNLSVPKGTTTPLSAVATFSDGTQQNISASVAWSAAPNGIATVSANGVVTGQAVGSATITASFASVSGSDALTVSPAILVSIAVAPASPSILLGATEQFASTGTFSDGSTQVLTNSTAWSSANSSIVSISPAAVAFAGAVGTTTISATSGAVSGSAPVTVAAQSMLTYFSQANYPATTLDATVRITNVGMTNGPLCAMVYVFDTRQEMTECCACSLSPDDLRTLSVNNDLTNHPATGVIPHAGVIEIISAQPGSNQACNASNGSPAGELSAWSTHIQILAKNTFSTTEAPFAVAALSGSNLAKLQNQCGFLMTNTSGMCTCGAGD